MAENEIRHWGYLSTEECSLCDRFLDSGYIITDVEDYRALEDIRDRLATLGSQYLDKEISCSTEFLNKFHETVEPSHLNDIRLHLIQKTNEENWLSQRYFSLARSTLEVLVGNELAMQRQVNLSIQLPADDSSLLPIHADVWSGDSPFEVVVWLPLVDCYGTKTMFLLPPVPSQILHEKFSEFEGQSSEDLYKVIETDLEWIEIPFGKVMIFNQTLPHGNRINQEKETRWSMNCRFKSVFSPYGDKKLGEFFVPITLRAASRIGMNYQYPGDKG